MIEQVAQERTTTSRMTGIQSDAALRLQPTAEGSSQSMDGHDVFTDRAMMVLCQPAVSTLLDATSARWCSRGVHCVRW